MWLRIKQVYGDLKWSYKYPAVTDDLGHVIIT